MSSTLVPMSSILPTKEILDSMARRRYQRPNVLTSQTRRPYYYFRYRAYSPSGEKAMQREQFIGWSDEISKKRAKELRDEWLKGVNNVPLVLQSQVQFTDFIVIWRRTHADGLKPRTRMQYASGLKCHILPKFGKLRLCDIDREMVQEWRVGLAAAMLPNCVRNLIRLLHNIFDVADDLGYWSGRNPAAKCKVKGRSPKRELVPIEQYRRLLACTPEPWNVAVRIAFETGLRIGEIRGLEWRDLDFAGNVIHVRRQLAQNGKEAVDLKTDGSTRDVSIGALAGDLKRLRDLAQGLIDFAGGEQSRNAVVHSAATGQTTRAIAPTKTRQQFKPTDRVMPWHSYDWTRRLLKKAAKDAGIAARRFGWHTLRHMHGTWMRELGADLMDVRDGMGHANLETTAGYVQNDRKRWEAAQLRLQEMVVSGGVN